jgi:nitric oxide reductase NorD protein
MSPRETLDGAWPERLAAYRAQLDCRFPQVGEVFEVSAGRTGRPFARGRQRLSGYRPSARAPGPWRRTGVGLSSKSGRRSSAASAKTPCRRSPRTIQALSKSPNGKAIAPFLQTLAAVSRRLATREQMQHYLDLTLDLMERTSGSIHGIHKTFASPGLPDFLPQAPAPRQPDDRRAEELGRLRDSQLPQRIPSDSAPTSACSRPTAAPSAARAARHAAGRPRTSCSTSTCADCGTTARNWCRTRPACYLRRARRPRTTRRSPCRCCLTTMPRGFVSPTPRRCSRRCRHRPLSCDSGAYRWSPALEPVDVRRQLQPDAAPGDRVLRRQPHRNADPAPVSRLRRVFLALHPAPVEGACNPETHSCLRHRLAMLSRALLDPQHGYQDASAARVRRPLRETMAAGRVEQRRNRRTGARLRRAHPPPERPVGQRLLCRHEVDYRDDNRHLWRFHELSDDEEMFDEPRADEAPPKSTACRRATTPSGTTRARLPARLGEPLRIAAPRRRRRDIDRLLEKHAALANA